MPPRIDRKVVVTITVGVEFYHDHGVVLPSYFKTNVEEPGVPGFLPAMVLIADTGAQVDIVGFEHLH